MADFALAAAQRLNHVVAFQMNIEPVVTEIHGRGSAGAQHAHLKPARADASMACPPSGSCGKLSAEEAHAARRAGTALLALPEGVRQLGLGDLITQAGRMAAKVAPAWRGDAGCAAVVECLGASY